MRPKYFYKGVDVTLDIYEAERQAAAQIAQEDGITFDEALERFCASDTYGRLQNPATLMWSESPAFLVDDFRGKHDQQYVK